MNRVFKYDGFKLQKSKFWWVCLLITMILVFFAIFALSTVSGRSLPFKRVRTITNPSSLDFLFAIMICIFVGNDFKTGTIKNIASKGIKRYEIVLSKLIWNFVLAITFTAVLVLSGLIAITLLTKTSISSKEFSELFKLSAIACLSLFALASLYTLITFIVRGSGIAIAVSIGVNILLAIIVKLLQILIFKDKLNISKVFPGYIVSITDGAASAANTTTFIIAMFVWIIVCSALSILIFQKQEIK
ncbi:MULTISPECIES: ABC transporter permease [unclassified Parvimonas]|jgi:hypothetical protein|uniref:ABC transporter permease n=1 Tax=unclassified Parvimonas TaxID=1151464 RepID=UPI002B463160|nr:MULTISPECIES: ABC transporter permease [unclassified Parvimonas]MEB3025011.1 ABC transporter permease [Parvimonas sp. M13]MEB3089087.1 ABC transporter permease [Parvimonas sp. M20]